MVEGGLLLADVDGLGNTSLEPVGLLVEYGHFLVLELVLLFLEVLPNVRWWLTVFFQPCVESPRCFPHIVGVTVLTLYVIYHSTFVLLGDLVLGVHEPAPDGIGWPHVDCYSVLPDALGYSVRDLADVG